MKIVVFGAGPIGLVTSLSLCYFGHDVLCIDTNQDLIEKLSSGHSELYEKGLQQQLEIALKENKIQFTTSLTAACAYSDIFFIAVGTPSLQTGACDLSQVESCLESIHDLKSNTEKKLVIKSTVPPGTHQRLAEKYMSSTFISHPEFLREGTAFEDAIKPDRILVGITNSSARHLMQEIYGNIIKSTKIFFTDPTSAELAKYAANAFLATRISLMNEFSKLADYYNADIKTISQVVGSDHRIGPEFLKAGLGYGGSCFPKDLQSLISLGQQTGIQLPVINAVETTNESQHERFTSLIKDNCSEKIICLWGLTFKPETNDLRNASSVKIIKSLLTGGYKIHAHDPVKPNLFFEVFQDDLQKNNVIYFDNHWEALKDSAGLAIVTEWSLYQEINLNELSQKLKNRPCFDGRNIFEPRKMKEHNINYFSLGQKK